MELTVYDIIKGIVSTPKSLDLRKKYGKSKPLKDARIAGCIHMTIHTAAVIET